jgi:Fe-S cluster assembly protein SufD
MMSETLPLLATPSGVEGGPAWLAALRRTAVGHYRKSGLPGPRTEAWKFTNLNALKALEPVATVGVTEIARPTAFADLEAVEVHLSNGVLTHTGSLPAGVEIVDLGAYEAAPSWVSETLGTLALGERHPFTALNTASFVGGAALRIARGAAVEVPLLLMIDTRGGDGTPSAHPRVLVVVEDGANADLIEVHTGTGAYVSNVVTARPLQASGREPRCVPYRHDGGALRGVQHL